MNTDFRLSVGLFDHPKFVKLRRRGPDMAISLLCLFEFVTLSRPDGSLHGMDAEDIAIAAKFSGDPDGFVEALLSIGWLDKGDDGALSVHDWAEHNPYAASAPERSGKASHAAKTRWEQERQREQAKQQEQDKQKASRQPVLPVAEPSTAAPDAPAMPEQCSEHDLALPQAQSSNAPSYHPTILPSFLPNQPPSPPTREPTESPPDGCVAVLDRYAFLRDAQRVVQLANVYGTDAVFWNARAVELRLEKPHLPSVVSPIDLLATRMEQKLALPHAVREERDRHDAERRDAERRAHRDAVAAQTAQRRSEQAALEAAWQALSDDEKQAIHEAAKERYASESQFNRDRLKKNGGSLMPKDFTAIRDMILTDRTQAALAHPLNDP